MRAGCAFEVLNAIRRVQVDTAKIPDRIVRNGMMLGIKMTAIAMAGEYEKAGDHATARDILSVLIEAKHQHELTQAHD